VGQIDRHGLRQFHIEDAVPDDLLGQLVREWSSSVMTVVRAVVADDDAEALRHELRVGDPVEACTMLMDRSIEVLANGTPIPRGPLASR
jgi:hypothetical protein